MNIVNGGMLLFFIGLSLFAICGCKPVQKNASVKEQGESAVAKESKIPKQSNSTNKRDGLYELGGVLDGLGGVGVAGCGGHAVVAGCGGIGGLGGCGGVANIGRLAGVSGVGGVEGLSQIGGVTLGTVVADCGLPGCHGIGVGNGCNLGTGVVADHGIVGGHGVTLSNGCNSCPHCATHSCTHDSNCDDTHHHHIHEHNIEHRHHHHHHHLYPERHIHVCDRPCDCHQGCGCCHECGCEDHVGGGYHDAGCGWVGGNECGCGEVHDCECDHAVCDSGCGCGCHDAEAHVSHHDNDGCSCGGECGCEGPHVDRTAIHHVEA